MTYRVIVWAPGGVGSVALAEVITHPDLELAGVFSYTRPGADAGQLVGLPATGVITTDDPEVIFSMPADVVLFFASKAYGMEANDATIVRLLEAEKNVITTTSYVHLPTYDGSMCDRVASACERGETTFFGTGENPGVMLERVLTTLTGICHRVDQIKLQEYVDVRSSPSPRMVFDVMSMGKPPADVSMERPMVRTVSKMYEQAVAGAAAVMDIELDRIEPSLEVAVLDEDITVAAGRISKGTVAAQRLTWTGYCDDKPLIVDQQIWYATRDIPGWNLDVLEGHRRNFWRGTVNGLPSIELHLDVWMPGHDQPGLQNARPTQLLTAMTAVRAIGEVCAAPPGILYAPVFAPFRPHHRLTVQETSSRT
ncbi:MAG: NAD(P)H-dependent amine dehydrogenase family protein [Mycobacterium sp.]